MKRTVDGNRKTGQNDARYLGRADAHKNEPETHQTPNGRVDQTKKMVWSARLWPTKPKQWFGRLGGGKPNQTNGLVGHGQVDQTPKNSLAGQDQAD